VLRVLLEELRELPVFEELLEFSDPPVSRA
jgi:hypothetical protein